jgi:hypothetical protein
MGLGYQWSWDLKTTTIDPSGTIDMCCDVGTFLNMDFELMPLQDKPSEKVFYACLDWMLH